MKIFIQGDRETAGEEALAVKKFCQLCAKEGITILAGAYGEIVRLAHESGAKVISHTHRPGDMGKIPAGVEFVDCTVGDDLPRSWAKRLGELLAEADGAVFLPGREGTLAHLIPFIAFAISARAKDSEIRRIALLGWKEDDFQTLLSLFNLQRRESPFISFPLSEAGSALDWITKK